MYGTSRKLLEIVANQQNRPFNFWRVPWRPDPCTFNDQLGQNECASRALLQRGALRRKMALLDGSAGGKVRFRSSQIWPLVGPGSLYNRRCSSFLRYLTSNNHPMKNMHCVDNENPCLMWFHIRLGQN